MIMVVKCTIAVTMLGVRYIDLGNTSEWVDCGRYSYGYGYGGLDRIPKGGEEEGWTIPIHDHLRWQQ